MIRHACLTCCNIQEGLEAHLRIMGAKGGYDGNSQLTSNVVEAIRS